MAKNAGLSLFNDNHISILAQRNCTCNFSLLEVLKYAKHYGECMFKGATVSSAIGTLVGLLFVADKYLLFGS